MGNRKLATIRRIKEIRDIPGADKIVCAVVDGWELVTQKSNNFKVGDLVIYFEIDSLLPEIPEFEWLRPYYVSAKNSTYGPGFRLKTIKLRGQISQGLILPLMRYDGVDYVVDSTDSCLEHPVVEGQDVTELLGVKKWERPIPAQLSGKVKGNFPLFIPKTDEERIQNVFDVWWEKWRNEPFEVTLKLDGSSATYYINGDTFGVCSRNWDLSYTDTNSFWKVAEKYELERKLNSVPYNFAIQGELMGPGVQDNREGFAELDFYVFNIYMIDEDRYLGAQARHQMTELLGLKHVPVISPGEIFSGFTNVKDFLRYAERPSIHNKQAEGVVFKSITNPAFSFKAISNQYLLSGGS